MSEHEIFKFYFFPIAACLRDTPLNPD